MNEQETLTQSIFNIIEEKKEKPEIFAWTKSPEQLIYNPSEVLYDSMLITSNGKGDSKTNRYILTLQGFLKCKVFLVSELSPGIRKRLQPSFVWTTQG